MEIGIYVTASAEILRPDRLARLIEEAGFDALTLGEHSHAAAGDYPDTDGVPAYANLLDLFVVMTSAAMATTKLKVSSGIMQLPQRDPISTAKQAATLDYLSDGRLDLVVATGSQQHEMVNHGVDYERRHAVMREHALAMREIFRNEVASFHGEFVNFDGVMLGPKRGAMTEVPLLIGGNGPDVEERALEYGDGWAPAHIDDSLAGRIAAFTTANPGLPVHVFGVETEPKLIERYASAGAARVVLTLESAMPEEAAAKLDEMRAAIDGALL